MNQIISKYLKVEGYGTLRTGFDTQGFTMLQIDLIIYIYFLQ